MVLWTKPLAWVSSMQMWVRAGLALPRRTGPLLIAAHDGTVQDKASTRLLSAGVFLRPPSFGRLPGAAVAQRLIS